VTKHSEPDKSIFETQIQNSENFNGQSNKRRNGSWSKILIIEGEREREKGREGEGARGRKGQTL
jgi:hypothetical protein